MAVSFVLVLVIGFLRSHKHPTTRASFHEAMLFPNMMKMVAGLYTDKHGLARTVTDQAGDGEGIFWGSNNKRVGRI